MRETVTSCTELVIIKVKLNKKYIIRVLILTLMYQPIGHILKEVCEERPNAVRHKGNEKKIYNAWKPEKMKKRKTTQEVFGGQNGEK